MKIAGIIPARFASTRFPGKPLADIRGKSMIRRVYEQCKQSSDLDAVVVATDDARIADHVTAFGGVVVMTAPEHPSGTDRCHEALGKMSGSFDYVINIQGDEPFIDPKQIGLLAGLLDGNTQLATLAKVITEPFMIQNPNVVKVVFNSSGEALYFSRSTIPHVRGKQEQQWSTAFTFHRHIGMYAYRTDVLNAITRLSPSSLELAESLEQLRWLENGYRIKIAVTDIDSAGIDTPQDIEDLPAHLS
ncbi:MAG: 3-deoxy-manno-octulosonate cytidylyltransferase [Bacteroidota bacterium]